MLNTSGIHIAVKENPGCCPLCGGALHVQKTVQHHGRTITHGQFEIRETIHVCAQRCRYDSGMLVIRRAKSLAEQIIPGRVVGYDVMVFVGLQRFLHHRQREEIRTALLQEHGIPLSTGEISNLARLFLEYLEDLHNERAEHLRDALVGDGGWPLHVDATGEDGRGTLLVVIAGWRQWVLGAWKVPTERADVILPCLRKTVQQFGAPCAVMRDLGRAVTPAVNDLLAELELDVPVLACHLHFLKDIGTDLLKSVHGDLRSLFQRVKILPKLRALVRDFGRKLGDEIGKARNEVKNWQEQTGVAHCIPNGRAGIATIRALAQWTLDFAADSTGLDFPFDRPYLDLHDRCVTARRAIDAFLCGCLDDKEIIKFLKRLQRILDPVICDIAFQQLTRRLRARAKLFDELRDALRLLPNSSSNHKRDKDKSKSTPELAAIELRDIQKEVEQLVTSLKERRSKRRFAQDTRNAIDVILQHLKNHGDYLWGHVINLPSEAGGGIRLLERTNNILEGFFRDMKHNERRRSGRKILTQDFESLPPAAALAYNLRLPDYVKILCGSLNCLAKAFAQLDIEKRGKQLAGEQLANAGSNDVVPLIATASLPTEDRKIIRSDEMSRRILSAANSRTPHNSIKLQTANQTTAK